MDIDPELLRTVADTRWSSTLASSDHAAMRAWLHDVANEKEARSACTAESNRRRAQATKDLVLQSAGDLLRSDLPIGRMVAAIELDMQAKGEEPPSRRLIGDIIREARRFNVGSTDWS